MKAQKIPYEGTSISPERTQAEITGLLYAEGAEATRWTTGRDGRSELEFIFKVQGTPVMFRITPALLTKRSRSRARTKFQAASGPLTEQVDVAASMRLVWWWLKAQLEAIRYGLTSVEEAFLAHVAGNLPEGGTVTVGQLLLPRIRSGKLLAPTDLIKALPAPEE